MTPTARTAPTSPQPPPRRGRGEMGRHGNRFGGFPFGRRLGFGGLRAVGLARVRFERPAAGRADGCVPHRGATGETPVLGVGPGRSGPLKELVQSGAGGGLVRPRHQDSGGGGPAERQVAERPLEEFVLDPDRDPGGFQQAPDGVGLGEAAGPVELDHVTRGFGRHRRVSRPWSGTGSGRRRLRHRGGVADRGPDFFDLLSDPGVRLNPARVQRRAGRRAEPDQRPPGRQLDRPLGVLESHHRAAAWSPDPRSPSRSADVRATSGDE